MTQDGVTQEMVEKAAREFTRAHGGEGTFQGGCIFVVKGEEQHTYTALNDYVEGVWKDNAPAMCAALNAIAPRLIAQGLREAAEILWTYGASRERNILLAKADALERGK